MTGAKARAAEKGVNLDVGEFPEVASIANGTDDPEHIAKITAHAVARIGDKFPLFRKISRHMEGADRRAGILSDVVAALIALYKRNPEAAEQLARGLVSEVKAQRLAKEKQTKQEVAQ